MKNKNLQTKKNENIKTVKTAKEAYGFYISETLKKTWIEEFVDEDTGEVVPIERNEVIFERGTLITDDVYSSLIFHLESGDIKDIIVSDQPRKGNIASGNASIWMVKASNISGKKKISFIMLAQSLQMAFEISKDYIELNYEDSFTFTFIKSYKDAVLLFDEPKEEEQLEHDFYYYEIEVNLNNENHSFNEMFILCSRNADTSKLLIEKYITTHDRYDKDNPYTINIESAKKINLDNIIPYDFSLAYIDNL